MIKKTYLCTAKRTYLFNTKNFLMLIIEVKDGESIDRALKRYKNKHRKVGLIQELRRRKEFVKPSVTRRKEVLKAEYINQKYRVGE